LWTICQSSALWARLTVWGWETPNKLETDKHWHVLLLRYFPHLYISYGHLLKYRYIYSTGVCEPPLPSHYLRYKTIEIIRHTSILVQRVYTKILLPPCLYILVSVSSLAMSTKLPQFLGLTNKIHCSITTHVIRKGTLAMLVKNVILGLIKVNIITSIVPSLFTILPLL
jgi:hypothetical protein